MKLIAKKVYDEKLFVIYVYHQNVIAMAMRPKLVKKRRGYFSLTQKNGSFHEIVFKLNLKLAWFEWKILPPEKKDLFSFIEKIKIKYFLSNVLSIGDVT